MIQDVGCDTSQPRGHVQDARLRRLVKEGAHPEHAKDCTLPVLVQLAIRAIEDGSVGVGLVKPHTSRERLAKAGHQDRGRQAGVAGRRHRALAALWRGRHLGKKRAFRVFSGSGGSRVRDSATQKGIDLSEISDAILGHSEVGLQLGYLGSEGKDLDFHCRRLRFTGGAGRVGGIFLKPVFR